MTYSDLVMGMPKFSETRGKKPFNWNKALNEKNIPYKKWKKMAKLSNKWITCACGNQCSIIPRCPISGSPIDNDLHDLGVDFYFSICKRLKKRSISVLKKIEERSAQLIEQEIIKLNHENHKNTK